MKAFQNFSLKPSQDYDFIVVKEALNKYEKALLVGRFSYWSPLHFLRPFSLVQDSEMEYAHGIPPLPTVVCSDIPQILLLFLAKIIRCRLGAPSGYR